MVFLSSCAEDAFLFRKDLRNDSDKAIIKNEFAGGFFFCPAFFVAVEQEYAVNARKWRFFRSAFTEFLLFVVAEERVNAVSTPAYGIFV